MWKPLPPTCSWTKHPQHQAHLPGQRRHILPEAGGGLCLHGQLLPQLRREPRPQRFRPVPGGGQPGGPDPQAALPVLRRDRFQPPGVRLQLHRRPEPGHLRADQGRAIMWSPPTWSTTPPCVPSGRWSQEGVEVDWVDFDAQGYVDPQEIIRRFRKNTTDGGHEPRLQRHRHRAGRGHRRQGLPRAGHPPDPGRQPDRAAWCR